MGTHFFPLGQVFAVETPDGELLPGSVRASTMEAVAPVVVREQKLWPTLSAQGFELVTVDVRQVLKPAKERR